MSMKYGRYYTIALYGINSFDVRVHYVQIAMTESMCDIMRTREWVKKKRVASENEEEEGVDE